jgi:hypothetical protein
MSMASSSAGSVPESSIRIGRSPRVWSWALFLLGVTLWLGLLTNWRWSWTTANAVHAMAALVAGSIALFAKITRQLRRPGWNPVWAALPAFSGGVVALLGPLLMFVPPFTIAAVFAADEIAHEQLVQREPSPSGRSDAIVRYRRVGAYAPGAGKLVITDRYRRLPFLERDVVGPITTSLSEDAGSFVRWIGPNRIRLEEHGDVFDVPGTRFESPLAVRVLEGLFAFVAPRLASRIDLGGAGDEAVTDSCAKWEVWGVRPGLMVSSIKKLDPDVSYRHQVGPSTHLWDIVLWNRRRVDQQRAPQLVQWRFGYEGTLVTDSAFGSSRVIAMRLSAGAIPLDREGVPVSDVPVIERLKKLWGSPTRTIPVSWTRPVAENWSPPAQHADIWIDESCSRIARVTWGDGPYMSGPGNVGGVTHRYYAIELLDSRAAQVRVEDVLAGRE